MKQVFISLLFSLLVVCSAAAKTYTIDEVPNVQTADSTRLVSNPDNIITAATQTQIDSLLVDIRRQTSCEVAMVLIGDIPTDTDIDNFATDLFGKWGIGKKDKSNGVLIVVAKDAHRYVIRTGYGAEGVLPDVVCGRIGRRILSPAFREGDYDGGLLKATQSIHEIMTDPEVRDELMSQLSDDDEDFTFADFMALYFVFALCITIALLISVAYTWFDSRDKDRHDKYRVLRKFQPITGYASFFCLALPLVIYLPLRYKLNQWRNGHHACPNCGAAMQKLDEVTDNNYLTPAQDCEEQLNSVDYDVWLCGNCGETDIYAFVNNESQYAVCRNCGARAARLVSERIIVRPTTSHEGYGEKEYVCQNCKQTTKVPYKIAKEQAVPPVVILPGGGRSSGGSGFGGGSFGGGMTGGGGASGSW